MSSLYSTAACLQLIKWDSSSLSESKTKTASSSNRIRQQRAQLIEKDNHVFILANKTAPPIEREKGRIILAKERISVLVLISDSNDRDSTAIVRTRETAESSFVQERQCRLPFEQERQQSSDSIVSYIMEHIALYWTVEKTTRPGCKVIKSARI